VTTIADQIIQELRAAGVRRIFGVPGGGSIADLIEAAGHADQPFSLAHTETSAALMASAQAEITGAPGACLATLGPGAAALMKGLAHAHLDRVPLLALTDCHDERVAAIMQHQTLDQPAMFAATTRWSARLRPADAIAQLRRAAALTLHDRPGPVHLDCPSEVADAPARALPEAIEPLADPPARLSPGAEALLRQARRPLLLLGLGAPAQPVATAVQALCGRHGIPALVTYKAKGVIPDTHPWFAGVLTHGALERPALERADLLLAIGLDPVELLARPWHYPQPIVSLSGWPLDQRHLPLTAACIGDLEQLVAQADACLSTSTWEEREVQQLAETVRAAMRVAAEESSAIAPSRLVELVATAYPGARLTVDAGAHMFPAMALWPAQAPRDVLISNGLATMGFALPAAIGATLLDPARPTVVLTGDGGLLMCLAELRTAAREQLPLRIIVFDDRALSLIAIKQIQRGYRSAGVSTGPIDWVALAASLGVFGYRASTEAELELALEQAAAQPGPALIAAAVDPQTYIPTIRALRG
jgi:acetolactate synthase-1/2/3 large subunit